MVVTQVDPAENSRKPISPAARRKAKEHNIDISKIDGTGPDGLITERDLIEFIERETSSAGARQSEWGEEEIVALTGIRKAMSERLSLSHQMVAEATTFAEVDMTKALELHQNMQIPITPFVVKSVAVAIPCFPIVNSNLADGKIVIKKYINIGVAVSTEEGLIVPVIHNAEGKTLEEIAKRLKQLAEKARDGQLSLDDVSAGTFTVTNSGIFGSLFFTPIVNYPETAIIGMGKVMKAPVVRDEQIVIRSMMNLSLSYDHRVIDGATAVHFLQKVKEGLEIPENLVSQKRT